jgi:hypothetical protein
MAQGTEFALIQTIELHGQTFAAQAGCYRSESRRTRPPFRGAAAAVGAHVGDRAESAIGLRRQTARPSVLQVRGRRARLVPPKAARPRAPGRRERSRHRGAALSRDFRLNPHFHTLALDGVYVEDASGELSLLLRRLGLGKRELQSPSLGYKFRFGLKEQRSKR